MTPPPPIPQLLELSRLFLSADGFKEVEYELLGRHISLLVVATWGPTEGIRAEALDRLRGELAVGEAVLAKRGDLN